MFILIIINRGNGFKLNILFLFFGGIGVLFFIFLFDFVDFEFIFVSFVVLISFIGFVVVLLIKRIKRINNNNKYIENRFVMLFFKLDFLNMNIGFFGILFIYGIFNYNIDLNILLGIYSCIFILLLILFSDIVFEWLFKI